MSTRARRRLFAGACLLAAALFAGLGLWQIERRAWKRDLIARVDARLHAAPRPLPPPARWPAIGPDDAYRRIRTVGTFLHDRETLVQALTDRGAGFWVMTPLRTGQGLVLVNRGFVPPERRRAAARAAGQVPGPVSVTGLLRVTEPGGGFLRRNNPANDRWFSRDVAAIARVRRLGPVAPFFLDADATAYPGGLPIGGLTVVRFRNTHLVYALTWFSLMAMALAGAWLLLRDRRPQRR